MADLATPAELLAHAAALEAAADYADFRDRAREKQAETALARRLAARLRRDYGVDAPVPPAPPLALGPGQFPHS
jgi:hypothetical protein